MQQVLSPPGQIQEGHAKVAASLGLLICVHDAAARLEAGELGLKRVRPHRQALDQLAEVGFKENGFTATEQRWAAGYMAIAHQGRFKPLGACGPYDLAVGLAHHHSALWEDIHNRRPAHVKGLSALGIQDQIDGLSWP